MLARRVLGSNAVRMAASSSARSFGASAGANAQLPQSILDAPATEISTLPNGLRVASEGGHGETATVGVWIDAGSRYENEKNNGVAHFLEHMAFKGTDKRTRVGLEVEIENMGGHLNAYTSREQTVYYAKVFKNDIPQAMDILSDILRNATFDVDAIERERSVILREMEEIEKIHEEVIFDKLHDAAFEGSGLGRTILGPEENIKSISRDDLKEYIATHYTAPRVVVAGAGAVDHKQLVELSEQHFGSLPTESPSTGVEGGNADAFAPAIFTGSDIRVRNDTEPLAHIALAFESASWTDPNAFPLMVMQTLVGCWDRTSGSGSNMSSKLMQTVGEQEIAHSVMSFNTCYKDTGLFGVYAITDPKTAQDLVWNTMEALVRLCHHTTEEEVARARTQLKATMLSQLDGSSRICEDIGRQMLTYNRRLSPAEIFARIDAVDAEAVKAAANQYINDKDMAVAATGAIHEVPDYNWIRRRAYWLRT